MQIKSKQNEGKIEKMMWCDKCNKQTRHKPILEKRSGRIIYCCWLSLLSNY